MGLLAASATKSYLIAYQNDLEYKINEIRQAKIALVNAQADLLNVGTDLDPENPVVKQMEQRKARLNLLEKKLDMQIDEYETKLSLIKTNMQECDKQMK